MIKNKTIFLWGILLCIFSQNVIAQRPDINFGEFSSPVPSVSSLASYNNLAQANVTGMPEISFPLFELPSRNKNIPLGTSISYSVLNIEKNEPASDIGTGWSLFGGGVISRKIIDLYDERHDDATRVGYIKNKFDDIYYYNAPGISGKFRFIRDVATNTFQLVNLSSNRDKIEYTKNSNTATLILDSFTITDSGGNKYYFNDYSRSISEKRAEMGHEFRSAFFLTKIVDAGNIEIANFTYEKYTKYEPFTNNKLLYQYCKLKSINSPGFGKIEYEYYFEEPWRMNDPYQVQKVILKDQNNRIISQYAFQYDSDQIEDGQLAGGPMEYIYKRMLSKIKKLDRNNTVFETTSLEYRSLISSPVNPGGVAPVAYLCPDLIWGWTNEPRYSRPLLRRIINQSGGVVEYNYEYGRQYKNRADPTYLSTILNGSSFIDSEIQYLQVFRPAIVSDTRLGLEHSFTVSGTAPKMLILNLFEREVDPPTPQLDPWNNPITTKYLDFDIYQNGTKVLKGGDCKGADGPRIYYLSPGNYTLKAFGTEGREGTAEISFYEFGHIPQPFPNSTAGIGIRINNIKYYMSPTDGLPANQTRFEYNSFTDPLASSGYQFTNEMDPQYGGSYTLYNNVKVIDDNNGYTQYYYKTPNDYPMIPLAGSSTDEKFWPYYNFTKGGLLSKKEIYSSDHQLLVTEQTDYSFEDIPGMIDDQLFYTSNSWTPKTYSKSSWMKKLTKSATAYFENGRNVQETSETDFGVFNFEPVLTKKIIDGRIEEQTNIYPESGYANLSAAHILNTPVIVEGKIDGKLISRTETKFENAASTLPTAITTSNIGNTLQKRATIDLYDEKGNVLQYTDANGNVVTTIYGYNKTLPIAKIEGATYAQVSSLVQSITGASDADAADPSKEPQLLIALDSFRNNTLLKNFQITTYTYDPLIGATTVTSANGMRERYQYDSQNRLEKVLDMNGFVLKEYKYNYKN